MLYTEYIEPSEFFPPSFFVRLLTDQKKPSNQSISCGQDEFCRCSLAGSCREKCDQQVVSYPSHLVQSDDWRVKERFQQLQDHLKRRVAFGFQNHHDRLRGISSVQNRHLRWIRMVTKSAVSKTYSSQNPFPFATFWVPTLPLNGPCGTLRQSKSTEMHAMIEILKHYLVDKLMMEVRHFELLQTPFRLRRIPWEHVLLQQQVYLRKWSMYSPSSSLNMAHNQISSALPPKVNKMLDPRNTFTAQRNNPRSGAMRSV